MMKPDISETDAIACVKNGRRLERRGYQGGIHIGRIGEHKILVKSAAEKGIASWMCRMFLRREYRVYQRLAGIKGIPHCYGFFGGRFLVLEYIDAQTMRLATITNRPVFFAEMFEIIKAIHGRGVAHGDLKRKDNILVTNGMHPCLLDFGVSAIWRSGLHPFNHFWYKFSQQHDLNAWLKLKYKRKFQNLSSTDADYYRPMRIEKMSRTLKRAWFSFKNALAS